MSNLDKSLKSIIAFQESLERLTRNPFESLIRQQELIMHNLTYTDRLIESAQQVQNQFAAIYDPQITAATQLQAQYVSLVEPIQRIANEWNNSALLSLQKSLAEYPFQQQLNIVQNSLASFSSAFESIAIHDNYVDMPEALIPDNFNYTEVARDIAYRSEETLPGAISVKKLSISDAIAVVYNLIVLLFTVITFLQTQQSSIQQQQNHEEIVRLEQRQISLQEDSNSMQQKENELRQIEIDSIEQNTEYLIEILNQLQEADEDSSVTPSPVESSLPDTDSCSQCGRLQSATAEPTNPTTADDSEHIADEPNTSEQR